MSRTRANAVWLARFLRAICHYLYQHLLPVENGNTWDGAAWALRLLVIGAHLSFAIPAFLRPNMPLFLPTYSAFDDAFPFIGWGYGGVFCVLLLWLLPTRSPWGLISSSFSTLYLFLVAFSFSQGVGLVSGALVYGTLGIFNAALMYRAFRATFVKHSLFERKGARDGRQ